jgi:cytochrome c
MFQQALIATATALVLVGGSAHAQVDEESAKALAKQSKCTKCHSVDKKKDGPSYKETAAKYKGKPDAVDKLYTHLTTRPEIEVDGKKEQHTDVKASDAEIRNLIGWILSR